MSEHYVLSQDANHTETDSMHQGALQSRTRVAQDHGVYHTPVTTNQVHLLIDEDAAPQTVTPQHRGPVVNLRHDAHHSTSPNLSSEYEAHEEHLSSISADSFDTISQYYEEDLWCNVSFGPLLSSNLILYHIIKYLDLHSNLAMSLVSTQMYLISSSDRIWSKYIVKSAKRGRHNWHIAWGGEEFWWMQRGERVVRQPIGKLLSNEADTMRLLNGKTSHVLLESEDALSRNALSDFATSDEEYEEVVLKNDLVHGFVDYVPCLSNQSGAAQMLSSISKGVLDSVHESRRGLSRSLWDGIAKVVPSILLPFSSQPDENTRPRDRTPQTPVTPMTPKKSGNLQKRPQTLAPTQLPTTSTPQNASNALDLQELRRMEYTPELALQYWRQDFAPEPEAPLRSTQQQTLAAQFQLGDLAKSATSPSPSDIELQGLNFPTTTSKITIPQIPGHGVKQSYALFKKTLRYEVEFRKFQDRMTRRGNEIDHIVKYRIKPCLWTILITYFVFVFFWTSITAPMLWDDIIPMDGFWWLIPFAGFGFFVPLFLLVLVLEVFFTGWIPCVSFFIKQYFQQTCYKMQALLQSSRIAIVHYMSYWFDPWHARDIESRILSIIALHLLYVPTLILCIGVNQLFFSEHKVMSYVVIPTYLCFLGSFLDFARRLFFGRKGRFCHVKVVHALLLINLTLIYLGIVCTIALAASKRDEHTWMEGQSWSVVSIPLDCSMGFLILNISFFRFYMIIRDAKYRYHQCVDWIREAFLVMVIFVVTSLIFLGFIAAVVLLPLKMDGTFDLPYTVVLSPVPLSILVVIVLLVVTVFCACSISLFMQIIRRTTDTDADV